MVASQEDDRFTPEEEARLRQLRGEVRAKARFPTQGAYDAPPGYYPPPPPPPVQHVRLRRGRLVAGVVGLVGLVGLSVQGGSFIINKREEERKKAEKEAWLGAVSRMLEGEQFISRQRHTIELFTPGTDEEFLFVGNYVVLNAEELPSFDIASLWEYNRGRFIPTVSPHEDKHTGIQLISFTGQFGDRALAVNIATTARIETRLLPMRRGQEHVTTRARLSMGSSSTPPYIESTLFRITDSTGAEHFVEVADTKGPRDRYVISTLTNLRKKQNGEQRG